ncbi:cupin domain-containing protein [Kiloniella laminariae]|uniref:cupin domain-containing protein n=1 Tax=Kiloniella laminariae TaxID=454162 RepID=UPI0003797B88|nr:cupin domain-containing protein [Kiloniella laminariae]
MTTSVGIRLKALREIHGLSQRELARRAGVTNSAISMIEQERVSPSIDSLSKVLSGFPITMIEFFTMEPEQEDKIFYSKDELVEMSDGTMSVRLVGANRKNRQMRVLHEKYPPNGTTGDKMIVQPGEEAGVIIRGQLEITVGTDVKVLSAGEAYYFSAEIPHRFRNIGDEECEVVSAATPPSF